MKERKTNSVFLCISGNRLSKSLNCARGMRLTVNRLAAGTLIKVASGLELMSKMSVAICRGCG